MANLGSIPTLVGQGMLDRAETLAREQMDAAALASDEAAKAAVALAGVRVAKLLRAPLDQQPVHLDAAIEPLQRVLRAYPDHRRAPWLRFQRLVIDLAVAQRQAAVLAASPNDERQRLTVLAVLIERGRELQTQEQTVAELIAVAFDQQERSAWIDELMALRNAIAVKRVEVLLSRGELFSAGSDDALAAAAEAQQAAIAALALVRDDPAQRAALTRMRCEALRRMGQAEQAVELLQPLLAAGAPERPGADDAGGQLDDATLALAVRLALELQQMPRAERLLERHYGDRPAEAAAAPESDLARLRYLIAMSSEQADSQQPSQQVGDWIETIRQRGGDFAQRRAETIAVELLGRSPAAQLDPRIVIAQAAAELRAGKAAQAAARLGTAAQQTAEPAAARRLAIAGAAALSSIGDEPAAAQLLLDVVDAQPQAPEAAALQLQAAVLLDRYLRTNPDGAAGIAAVQVDDLLRQTIQLWPHQPAAAQARDWLVTRLLAAEQHVEAAIVASPQNGSAATAQQWETAVLRWSEALAKTPLVTAELAVNAAVEQLALQALEHLPADLPAAAIGRRQLIALFGNAALAAAAEPTEDDEAFIRWLLAVRCGDAAAPPPDEVNALIRRAAAERLVADGIAFPARRAHLAAAIEQLDDAEPTLARATALLWSERWREADAVLDRWLQLRDAASRPAAAMTAAKVLSQAPQPDAKRRALARLAAASAKLPQGSAAWHAVKLATLELLSELDQRAEAARLAQYILLTRPPDDPATLARYQKWSEP